VTIHQDALLYATKLAHGAQLSHLLAARRTAYVQVARGEVSVNGHPLRAGDGARIESETSVVLGEARDAEVLLFDLP
jgi:redox-sensitive bicupin YhaK (pirin superfamily)